MKNNKFYLIYFIALFLFLTTMKQVSADSYTDDNLEKLKNGEVILKNIDTLDKKGLEAAEAKILIYASPQKVWDLLDNQEKLDEIVPKIKDITVLKKDFSHQKVKVNLLTTPLLPVLEYTLILDEKEKYKEIKFKKVEGSFRELYGAWRIEPYKGKSILTYIMYIDFGFYLPHCLREFGLNRMLPDTLKAIKIEAEK